MPSSSPPTYGLRACLRVRAFVLEPISYRDVVVHPEWQLVMAEEIAALERTDTQDLVSLPPCVHPVTCKWFYKVETCADGSLEHYKARLMAHGFQREHGM